MMRIRIRVHLRSSVAFTSALTDACIQLGLLLNNLTLESFYLVLNEEPLSWGNSLGEISLKHQDFLPQVIELG